MSEIDESASLDYEISTASRLGLCGVCEDQNAHYTCPRCEMKTCSLKCSMNHKKRFDCSGVRDRTKFIPVKKFTNLDLLSDYRFLEDAARLVENCHKDKTRLISRTAPGSSLPTHLNRLRGAAYQRKIFLRFLPQLFTRHKENTTYYDWKRNVIAWKITWNFDQADFSVSTERVKESTKISEALANILEDPQSTKRLEYYLATSFTDLKVLLQAEGKHGGAGKFYDLDLDVSLRSNLTKKVIVEHPVFHVITSNHASCYEIIDPDDESADEAEAPDVNVVNVKEEQPPVKQEPPDFDEAYRGYYEDYLQHYRRVYNVENSNDIPTEVSSKLEWSSQGPSLPKPAVSVETGVKRAASSSGLVSYSSDEDGSSPSPPRNRSSDSVESPHHESETRDPKMPRLDDASRVLGEGEKIE